MLYVTLAAIIIGNCAIGTSAKTLVVTSTSDMKMEMFDARVVNPTTKGRVGWLISYENMKAKFPNLDFEKELIDQLKVTSYEKPLNHLTIAVNMKSEEIAGTDPLPANVVATYTAAINKYGLYHKDGEIALSSDCYFEADEE